MIKWIQEQVKYSDAVRVEIMAVQRAERARRRRRRSRDRSRRGSRRSHSRSRSRGSASSSGPGEDERERRRLKFRLIAKEKPGVTFASVVANCRQALGQYGVELDVGTTGPIFRKWWESSFTKQHAGVKLQPYADEMLFLVTALDEFYAGRVVEIGDLLASRLRYFTSGIQKDCFQAARHFLVYHYEDMALVPEPLMDAVLKVEELEHSRQERIAKARSHRSGR